MGNDCMKIFGYMRISTTDKQTTARQELTLGQYADKNSFKFDQVITDKISGTIKVEIRPAYSKLKSMLRENDVIVVTDLDRLGRNADNVIMELKELKKLGIKVVALDMPYMNEWNRVSDNSLYNLI